ncbi:hypothetical protein HHK36_019589 [Tetracentron sinense]|uniref:RRM domain-containing protein n=1 Tax=Tetracentron sinense TaxID=13715 RepID=A0A834YU38_TETSI|nr:hypothetical protein HHK36_019589 [Tetracentron sinense]
MAKKRKLSKSVPEPESEPIIAAEEPPAIEVDEEEEEQEEIEEEEEEDEEYEVEDEDEDEEDTENTDNAPNKAAPPAAAPPLIADGETADEDDSDPEEPVEKLLEPFTKDQLINLLREAAEKHPDFLDRITKAADVDPVHRKIFVHGLGWDTTAETLANVFKQYGEIEECKSVCDKISGKSKGYGFILFKNRSGARKALKEPQKKIGSRMTACQLASSGPVPASAPVQALPATPAASEYTQRKIYVSNVSADIDPQRLLNFFAKFGEIEEGPLGLDKQTGKPRGFSLFVYKSAEGAKKSLEEPHKNFEGHMLHCQKAVDGPKPNKSYYHSHQHPGGGPSSHFPRSENPNFVGGMGNLVSAGAGSGHMMAGSPAGMPFNQGVAQALNPALGQAITTLLATQGAGLGLTNLLGTLGSSGMGAPGNQTVPQMVNNTGHGMQGGYGNQGLGSNISSGVMGGYGNQPGIQGGYSNPQMGQANTGRSQQGVGHMGGIPPYMGH